MRVWCQRALSISRHEVRQVLSHPVEWIAGLAVPLFWALLMSIAFGTGIMTKLPVGLVDMDRSALSRETIQALDAIPSIRLETRESSLAADEDLRARRTYGTITIPKGFEEENRRGAGAPVVLELNKTYYAIGTILEVDIKTALSTLQMTRLAVKRTAAAGGTFTENGGHLRATLPDVWFLGNPSFNFVAYLLPTFVPGLMALGALLAFVSMLAREWREGGLRMLLKESGGSATAIVVGKLAPWLLFWLLAISVWTAGFAGWAGWGAAGPLFLWFTAGWLLILAMAGLALLVVAISPTWLIALSASICLVAPTFPFTGFSFPLDAMTPGARAFGELLPLTHYLEAQSQIWVMNAPLDAVARTQMTLALFPIICFAAALLILPLRIRQWKKAEAMAAGLRAAEAQVPPQGNPPAAGFWKTFALTLKASFLSRDTIAIFGMAAAFYLVFYGWPYGTQQIENIPTGILDLDRSGASRRLINALDASPTTKISFVLHSESEALDLFRRQKTDVLVTIPEDYSESLARGENTTIHILGSGAYPVKARAVQSAAAGIISDKKALLDNASLMTPGTPVASLEAAAVAAPGLLVTYRFNEISGYGNYTVPMVGPVILQAVILMGIGMAMGGWLAGRPRLPFMRDVMRRPWCEGLGVFLAFWSIAFGWMLYIEGFGFRFGDYGAFGNPEAVILVSAFFSAAVTAFGLAVVTLLGSNAWAAPVTVIISAPALFISGAVWPLENLHWAAIAVSQLIPTTPGIFASAAAAQDGAELKDILPALLHLLLLTGFYGLCYVLRLASMKRPEALQGAAEDVV